MELYAIHWDFDISSVDPRIYERLDDVVVEEELGIATNNTKGGNKTRGSPQKITNTTSGSQESSRPKTACCSIF